MPDKEVIVWASFSKAKLISAIEKCNNSLTLEPDKLFWRYLKKIVKNEECIDKLIDIANGYIDLGYWPSHFKILTTIIILKQTRLHMIPLNHSAQLSYFHGRSNNAEEKQDNRQLGDTGRNTTKWYQKKGDITDYKERRQISMGAK